MLKLVTKTLGDLTLKVAPELGGAIAALQYRDVDILRPLPALENVIVNQSGSFPLIPFSNRIANGIFEFEGEQFELLKNFGEHPHTIHGNAWHQPWIISEEASNGVVLKCLHQAEGDAYHSWPWPYQATQVFELKDNELHVTLSYFNLAERNVPVGLGFHPYFANAKDALVRFAAKKVLLNDANTLPCAVEDVPAKWDYSELRAPVAGSVDNCFAGWDGHSEVRWPDAKVKAEVISPDAKNAVFFMPPAEKNFVAIEPVTNVNNAINDLTCGSNDQAMKLVGPGQSVSVTMIIKVSDCE
ncbi:aldose 1-epimerase [Ferrimonas lipolytica]|uniref:Aldose 1-epimerase n=1 Tax=Ferrimonas lipolytica TaxID=2724191 RepID=A0A6H1UEI0_9GAMM|nr:aldose 1-epimerase [Ferrimonas lipolytica]QIZ77491.1 aldose 1-epimerase [Ferrimonas lipolytica]